MLIGVVSDTHGHLENTRAAVRMLESLEVERVIHCGDVGSPEVVPLFAPWPTHFVFGNVDSPRAIRAAIEVAGQFCHDRFADLDWEGVRIAVLHGDDGPLLRQTIADGKFQLVCSGHTHVASESRHNGTLALNPGALYRANPHTFAIVELPALAISHVTV